MSFANRDEKILSFDDTPSREVQQAAIRTAYAECAASLDDAVGLGIVLLDDAGNVRVLASGNALDVSHALFIGSLEVVRRRP